MTEATTIAEISEWEVIARLLDPEAQGLPARGVGDDCALLDLEVNQTLVTSIDTMVEGRHFRRQWTTPAELGQRLVTVAASDLAAAGAAPCGVLLALSLPGGLLVDEVRGLARGVHAACDAWGLRLLGGDTTASDLLVATVTVLGAVAHGQAITRSGAQVGDELFVTGTLGRGALGLGIVASSRAGAVDPAPRYLRQHSLVEPIAAELRAAGGDQDAVREAVRHYVTPRIRLDAGQLVAAAGATSMIDVSDGLAGELHHLARASQVGFEVQREALPVACGGAEQDAARMLELALEGGDDYELLFTAPPSRSAAVAAALGDIGVPVRRIGVATAVPERVTLEEAASSRLLPPRSFTHFA